MDLGCLIWDFGGTLAFREGGWSKACADVLRREKSSYDVDIADVRPHLQEGFPWHTPNEPHTDISTSEEWWEQLYPLFADAFEANGVPPARARSLAEAVRPVYLQNDWHLVDDTVPTLSRLSARGWTHLILSNHVPELEAIVRSLGLADHIDRVYTSAHLGYEKPHPKAFQPILSTLEAETTVWMVGDSFRADVQGASNVGVSGILVRNEHPEAAYTCDTLSEVAEILNE